MQDFAKCCEMEAFLEAPRFKEESVFLMKLNFPASDNLLSQSGICIGSVNNEWGASGNKMNVNDVWK
jgi:hypothetical protein